MKKILLVTLSLLMISPVIQAKEKEEVKMVLVKDDASDDYYYESVVPVEGVAKEEMFKRAKEWVLLNLKTSDNNVDFNEKELSIINSGTVLLSPEKKAFQYSYEKVACDFKLKLWFKDGRYKFRIDNIVLMIDWGGGFLKPNSYDDIVKKSSGPYRRIASDTNITLAKLMAKLESVIKGTGTSGNDW